MKYRIRLLALVVAAILLGALAVSFWRSPQPSFRGQLVSWWFDKVATSDNPWWVQEAWLDKEFSTSAAAVAFREDVDVFKAMGPAVVPYLFGRLRERPPSSSAAYRNLLIRMPAFLRRAFPRPRDPEQERRTADLILKQLGEKAYPAVPDLIGMLENGDPREQLEAINILKNIGSPATNALPALTSLLKGADAYLRVVAADAVRHIAPARTPGLMGLYRESLEDKQAAVRMMAVSSLWEIRREPELVVPTLVSLLGDISCGVLACTVLKQCGQSASNAVPSLISQLADARLELRVAAAAALRAIDPGAEPAKVQKAFSAAKAAGLIIRGLDYETTIE